MGCGQQSIMALGGVAGGPDPNPKSLIFACGLECGQLGSVGQHWTSNAASSISTSTTRTGARSLRYNPSALDSAVSPIVPGVTTHKVSRFYVRFATLPSADCYINHVSSGTGRMGVAFKQSDSKIYCASGSAPTMGATGVSVTTGVWYRIDFYVNETPGAKTADAQVNGVAVTQKTSADGSAVSTGMGFGGRGNAVTGDWFYDDVAISTTAADYPIGAGHVNHFVPVSDGTHNIGATSRFLRGDGVTNISNATTDAYTFIDEVPLDDTTPDSQDFIVMTNNALNTEYVETVFGPASGISSPTLGPRGVEVIVADHQSNTNVCGFEHKIYDNGSEDAVYTHAAGVGSNGSIVYRRKHYVNPPSAASVWTTASGNGNFNNLRYRCGYDNSASNQIQFDAAMIEAEFSD